MQVQADPRMSGSEFSSRAVDRAAGLHLLEFAISLWLKGRTHCYRFHGFFTRSYIA